MSVDLTSGLDGFWEDVHPLFTPQRTAEFAKLRDDLIAKEQEVEALVSAARNAVDDARPEDLVKLESALEPFTEPKRFTVKLLSGAGGIPVYGIVDHADEDSVHNLSDPNNVDGLLTTINDLADGWGV